MSSLLRNLPLLVFFFVLFSVIRAIVRAAQLSQKHQSGESETAEQRRVREIQERIRRKIAERRGGLAPLAPVESAPATRETSPMPRLRPASVPPLEPFGGPSRRLVIESMRRSVTVREEPPAADAAALERQRKLAEEIRALDEARVAAERRAAQVMAQRDNVTASSSVASARHAGWLGDVRDPQALRRAIVLREVLGAPVALR